MLKSGIYFILAMLIALSLGCHQNESSWTLKYEVADRPSFVLGHIPYKDFQRTTDELWPLAAYLGEQQGMKPVLKIANTYESLGELLDTGDVDLAWFSFTSYYLLSTGKRWEVLCIGRFAGKTGYRGVILTKKGSGVTTLASLKGKRFAYVDRHSGSGFWGPNMLFAQAGINPLSDFGSISFTGRHSVSITGLLEGRFDAVAVYDHLYDSELPAIEKDQLAVVARTEAIPPDLLVVRSAQTAQEKEKLRTLLEGIIADPSAEKLKKHLAEARAIEAFSCRDVTLPSSPSSHNKKDD